MRNNSNMKRFILSTAFVLCAAWCSASSVYQLTVEMKDGDKVSYILSDKPVVTFNGTQVLIKSEKAEAGYELSTVQRYYFEEVPDGISTTPEDDSSLHFDYSEDNHLTVYGIADASTVSVYDITGRPAPAAIDPSGKAFTIDLSILPTGVYIITLPNHSTLKIKK